MAVFSAPDLPGSGRDLLPDTVNAPNPCSKGEDGSVSLRNWTGDFGRGSEEASETGQRLLAGVG
jgi:hypothetical protein